MFKQQTRPARRAVLAAALMGVAMFGAEAQAVATTYSVTQTYDQVVFNPTTGQDTIFTGTFSFDSDTQTVSGLTGTLSQSMTGNTAFRALDHMLSTVFDAELGGWLVSVFHQDSTDVFQGGGFATGGFKEFGNQNAYVTLFVNATDPAAALSQSQINRLAYGDCTTGSLMGTQSPKTCMTGWVKDTAGVLGAGGTMQGTFPVTQTIAAVPEPESYAMLLAGLGLIGFAVRRRTVR